MSEIVKIKLSFWNIFVLTFKFGLVLFTFFFLFSLGSLILFWYTWSTEIMLILDALQQIGKGG